MLGDEEMMQYGDYPADKGLPEEPKEKVFIFNVYGEIHVEHYNEEGAEEELKNNLAYYLKDAYHNDDLTIE